MDRIEASMQRPRLLNKYFRFFLLQIENRTKINKLAFKTIDETYSITHTRLH